jgi:NAD(P)H dehydrogenase (quinone)
LLKQLNIKLMKIYILLGHPDAETFNGDIAETYYKAALAKGHEVRYQRLGEMKFDPILWKGYKEIQHLEPDLLTAKDNIEWCEKWVIIYPIWWGSIPALLKGFFDRVLYPGFAFKYHETGPLWDKLLKGRTGEVIRTCDAPGWWIWLAYRNSDINAVKRAVLQFCGISPVKTTRIASIKKMDAAAKQHWLTKIANSVK